MSRLKNFWKRGTKQKVILIFLTIVLAFAIFIMRDSIQPGLLWMRKYLFIGIVFFIILFIGLQLVRAAGSWRKMIWTVLSLSLVGGLWYLLFPMGIYKYMETYAVFKNIKLEEINTLPLTRNERIQPWNNIVTMAHESISETDDISAPQLVRIDGENRWTMAIQPAEKYFYQRARDNTEELFSVPSTKPLPVFAEENRVQEVFSIGESLAWSRNTYNAVVQKFSFFDLFCLEPDEVFYMKNDNGKWVQVVNLIRWKGIFFPYPTFGGVMVIEAGEHGTQEYIERLLWGKGKYICPHDMKNYRYLQGQNILSLNVSRIEAESLKFLGGFTDPLPWNMKTAVKIPDMPDDQNEQPFVTDFDFSDVDKEAYNGLYHWFGLEPIGEQRTGLTFSVMIPSDGTSKVYYYNHGKRKQGYAGVSAMPAKVIESKKEYDWTNNRPVEFRPYIKDILGKRRLFMLGTVVAKRRQETKTGDDISEVKGDGAATPDLALIDVQYKDVIWIDTKRPSTWDEAIMNQMSESWGIDASKFNPKSNEVSLPADTSITSEN
jgi:hypothetical protein